MDSGNLARNYPEAYMEFFADADLVYRIPHSVSLLGWTACAMGWVVMEQKIPLNCYVSIKKTKHEKITIGNYISYSPKSRKFEKLDSDKFEHPGTWFTDMLQKLYPKAGYELSIFNELSSKTPDTVSFLAVLALECKENPEFSLEKFSMERKHAYESKLIRELIRKAESLRLEYTEDTRGLSSMSTVYCALQDGTDAIIHKAEIPLPLPRKDEIHSFSQSNQRKFSWTIIRKIFWEAWTLPFEIMIAKPRITEKNSHWYWELASNIIGAEAIASEMDLAMQASWNSLSRRYSPKEGMEMIVACSAMLTLNAINAIKRNHEGKIVENELFWLLNKAHEGSKYLLWKSNLENFENEESQLEFFKKILDDNTAWRYTVFRTGNSIDMNYVVMFSKKTPHEDIVNISKELEAEENPYFNVIYSSICDKYSDPTINIVTIREILWDTKGEGLEVRHLGSVTKKFVKEWFSEFNSAFKGIVIDTDTWKIYANGIRATSKEIPSQQFTTEVFKRLASDGSIRSNTLPLSTYSTSKNETISKILTPFRKYFLSQTWKDIEWLIDWNETDFQFRIKNLPIEEISIVKRLFQE